VAVVDECGFDPDQWNPSDALSTLRVVHVWFAWLCEGASKETVAELAADAGSITRIRRNPASYDEALAELHTAWHALDHAGRVRHRETPPQQGEVVQVSSSLGGVPKRPVDGPVAVEWSGLTVDQQDDRDNHGRPWQAMCLWSVEVIDALVAEGHPIAPGYAGENLTIGGLDWSAVTPGQRLRVGTALLETTPYSTPCSKNAPWFIDGDFRRMAHDLHPGWSRIYARVIEPGLVATGDAVSVLP
jgi:MOSC domain-containing protein YiiM